MKRTFISTGLLVGLAAVLVLALVTAGCASAPAGLTLSSPAFTYGGKLPAKYTGDGDKISFPLNWANAPQGTQSLAVIIVDPDIPAEFKKLFPDGFLHMALVDIPKDVTSLTEGAASAGGKLPVGARMLPNHFAVLADLGYKVGQYAKLYGPPWPPDAGPSKLGHGYKTIVYAISVSKLPAGDNATFPEIMAAIEQTAIGEAVLVGFYGPAKTPLP